MVRDEGDGGRRRAGPPGGCGRYGRYGRDPGGGPRQAGGDPADRGQAVPLLVAMVAVAALTVWGFGTLGADVADAARARTAADAAALAGAVDGEAGASRLAAANGGVVESFVIVGADVVVRVRVRAARATARATLSPDPPP